MSPRKHILLKREGATFLAVRRASGKGRGLEKPVMPPMQESDSLGLEAYHKDSTGIYSVCKGQIWRSWFLFLKLRWTIYSLLPFLKKQFFFILQGLGCHHCYFLFLVEPDSPMQTTKFNLALKAFVVLRSSPVQPRMAKTFLAATLHYWGYRSICQHPRL